MRDDSDNGYSPRPGTRRRGSARSGRSRSRYARSTGSSTEGSGGGRKPTGELQQAVDRFEQAVQDLVGSATNEFSDRATSFLNETTSKLEREFGSDAADFDQEGSDAAARMAARRRARARARSSHVLERSPRLERDDENAKIVGVCAGIANYYGVEAWVVRCIAVTGLLFFGSIVFPAYWIMYFVMDHPKASRSEQDRSSRRGRRGRRGTTSTREQAKMESRSTVDHSIAPRRNLRNVQADLQEVELRLRRMETHVTSGQYELQRELHKIESEDAPVSRTN